MTSLSLLQKLAAQVREARAIGSSTSTPSETIPKKIVGDNALFLGTYEDKEYLSHLKGLMGGFTTYFVTEPMELLTHLEVYCAKRSIKRVVSTNTVILRKLLEIQGNFKSNPSLSNYAGSLFSYKGIDIVFINPLKQVCTVSYGRWITQRFISKVIAPSLWPEASQFKWSCLDSPSKISQCYEELSSAYAIAVDIETFKTNLVIRCIGYTGIFLSPNGSINTHSYVLPIDSEFNLYWMRKINDLPAQKIFQNGKYDNSYLLRYNAPVRNWLWDTSTGMHGWYAELPKDLAFQNAFFLRKVVYWKDLAETPDLYEYYKYNALDTWATANVWIQQMLQSPDWAKRNYFLEFPIVYPCLLAEMTGLPRETEKILETRKEVEGRESPALSSLRNMAGLSNFNPGSSQQTVKLLHVLGNKDIDSSEEKFIKKAMVRHPLNALILGKILDIRGWRKLCNTYLRIPSDADSKGNGGSKEFRGHWLYTLNPHGTDTGRLSSGEHHFWCGANIQNAPTRDGPEVKQTCKAPEGFYIGECDLEQAESRDTANISGDTNLIAAVSGTRDFHSSNASAFFGVPYNEIYDDEKKKTKNKKLRDLAKRVNHGANYNMGAAVLVDTMGIDKIWEAKTLLGLKYNDPKEIAQYLLDQFHRTYPAIRNKYYASVVNEVGTTHKLVSRAYHHTEFNLSKYPDSRKYMDAGDWSRYCFGNPAKNKLDLNSYVAHCPQSLNARTLNEGFMKVFYEVALPQAKTFRLHAQIHDSILFSYKEGYEAHAEVVRKCMEIPVTVLDVSGNYRTFTVPASLKLGKDGKPAIYWSETE